MKTQLFSENCKSCPRVAALSSATKRRYMKKPYCDVTSTCDVTHNPPSSDNDVTTKSFMMSYTVYDITTTHYDVTVLHNQRLFSSKLFIISDCWFISICPAISFRRCLCCSRIRAIWFCFLISSWSAATPPVTPPVTPPFEDCLLAASIASFCSL
uniref:Uncharacterized protein n=1 Tax=Ciona intestinalis TaxID=7719 RepID=H2XUB8_CIOIN